MNNVRKNSGSPRLTLSMVVRNEADRYLRQVLESAREYITDAVIIDDNSSDNTASLCHELLAGIPHKIIENRESAFHNEWKLRYQQWIETIRINPEWILFLDADEIFEESFKNGVKELLQDANCSLYSFRLYDFWDEDHYRDDGMWKAHKLYRPFLLRYHRDFDYEFNKLGQHCGRMPANVYELPHKLSNYRLKHMGWAKKEDRIAKYERYMKLDPKGEFGSLTQYQSILDEAPNLVKWEEEPRPVKIPESTILVPLEELEKPETPETESMLLMEPALKAEPTPVAEPALKTEPVAEPVPDVASKTQKPGNPAEPARKLLIGSPVCQHPAILYTFLFSLKRLNIPNCEVYYHFIDDNHEAQSRTILRDFQNEKSNVLIERFAEQTEDEKYSNHGWKQEFVWKVAGYKDRLIERARKEEFDYLFLIDSDILLHPDTVSCLMSAEKDIIAEVYWTKWAENSVEQPQVWLHDFYTQHEIAPGERLTKKQESERTFAFFNKLRDPGVYEVGGLGACTLISQTALKEKVSFARIGNITYWGEDRHFCIRAKALGLDLFVDTHYPAYHVYRLSDMAGGVDFLKETSRQDAT